VQAGRADGAAGPRAARGRLRTYLGIAPGVGKTYAMLRDGRAQRRSGVDTVLAFWQRHGRAATAAQVDGLEVLTGTGSYRGVSIEELDVDAVLARHPELALVDELAYANPPGARHPKRWQDVDDLLEAGIDVYTTLNVGNIESLGPLVSRITGVRVSEPVPDAFVRAGQLQLVDLAPAALRRRLAQGLVFPAEQADAALSQYFKFANLAALRELAQLWLDDSVPDPVAAFLAAHGLSEAGEVAVIVVGLAGSPADQWLIRYAARLAELSGARLRGVHVRPLDNMDRAARAQLAEDRRLLKQLHGEFAQVRASDPASGLIRAARKAGAAQLVIGSRRRSRLSRLLTGSTVADQVLRMAGDLPVQAVNVGQSDDASGAGVARPRREAVSPQPLPTIDGPPIHAHVETVVRAVACHWFSGRRRGLKYRTRGYRYGTRSTAYGVREDRCLSPTYFAQRAPRSSPSPRTPRCGSFWRSWPSTGSALSSFRTTATRSTGSPASGTSSGHWPGAGPR
jgi:two-component system, OmpR family, sensor histidine kinase KdpD